jgi:NRPS condensation-like uncharacterized protein
LEKKNLYFGKDFLKLDNAAKVFPAQNTKQWSNVIRYSINLTVDIDPVILEKALNDILPRFPSMCVKIKRGVFWYYFEYNDKTPVIAEDDLKHQCVPIRYTESNDFLFKIFYLKNRLTIEAFHALTDGYGCEIFLNTLAAQYLRLKGHKISTGGSVFDITEKPKKSELEDSFLKNATKGAKASRSKPNVYHRKGEKLPAFCSHVTVGYMPVDKIKELCKKYNATITEFFTAVLVEIYIEFQKREEKKQKEISIQVPVNSRNQFESETLRNFSVCYSVRIDPNLGDYTFEEILKQVSLYLRYINNPKTLGAMFASNIKLESFPLMRVIPLVIKDLAIGISYALTAESTTTALFSNVGKVDLPEDMRELVESCILMPAAGLLNGGRMAATSVNNTFTVAIADCYDNTDIERAFFTKLSDMGIPARLETNYSTSSDNLLEPLPQTEPQIKKKNKHWAITSSLFLLLPGVISVILNFLLIRGTPWSAYVVFATGLLWSLSVLPFIARKFLTKFHSIMAVLSTITTFSLLLLVIMYFIPHSIIFDFVTITTAVASFILFATSLIAIKNKKFKKWLSKKFYF